jgi:antitoxin component of RelBE/YafQ-DinJ toxin-antitoxin module
MIKEKDITIRVDFELKQLLQKKAKELGLSLSSYIRSILIKEVRNA